MMNLVISSSLWQIPNLKTGKLYLHCNLFISVILSLIATFILLNFPFARYCAVSIARDTASIWRTLIGPSLPGDLVL